MGSGSAGPGQQWRQQLGSLREGSTSPCCSRGRESSRLPLESSLTQGQQVITWQGLGMVRIYHGRLILQLCDARRQARTSLIFQSSREGFCWGDLRPGNQTELPPACGSALMVFNRMCPVGCLRTGGFFTVGWVRGTAVGAAGAGKDGLGWVWVFLK